MTRDQILEVAAQIFRQKGFHAASMQQIADAVHLRKASLYHHVSSKQELLLELLNQAMDLLIEKTSLIFSQPASPADRLHQAIRHYVRALIEHPDLANVLLLEYRSLDPDLRTMHQPRRDQFEGLWRGLIQEGLDAGVFQQTDASICTKAILGSLHWTLIWYREDGPLSVEQIASILADHHLHGLLACPGATTP